MSEERFVFLGGHRKCGTTMFLNLFDGHEACCVFPTDISVLFSAEQRLERLDRVIIGVNNPDFFGSALGTMLELVKHIEASDRFNSRLADTW